MGSTDEIPKFTDTHRGKIARSKRNKTTTETPQTSVLKDEVKLILHTCNDNEYWAVREKLKPPVVKDSEIKHCIEVNSGMATIGIFAGYTVAVLFTRQCVQAESPLDDALKVFQNAEAILGLGIGYGKDRESIKFADVMVSDFIDDASQIKIERKKVKRRGSCLQMENSLLQHFRKCKSEWDRTFKVSAKRRGRSSEVKLGTIVSSTILLKDKLIKTEFMNLMEKAVGGEMEGWVLCKLVEKMKKERRQLSVAVIKGVSDYGDEEKSDDWQFTAAKAAVDFAHFCLQKTDGKAKFIPVS